MLFNSIEFLIYLPIVFILYWYVFQRHLKIQNIFIVAVSYIFYGWWNWKLLYLIALTSFLSWLSGMLIDYVRCKRSMKEHRYIQWIKYGNIIINLGILGVFKYYNFFVESFVNTFASFGIHLSPHTLQLILPVGISFYTFQALSYTIDVSRKAIRPTHDIIAFFAYVCFFPQLVAGPIERATHLLPQFYQVRRFNYEKAVDGMRQIIWGFFKKIVIADNCAAIVNPIWNNLDNANSGMLIMGAILFAFQIYGDFSGYSDIAIGTARLFGIDLKKNFHFPYFSKSISEFWRRWHISLNTWFIDYIYIPLGGNRCSKWKQLRNTMIVFALSGLWHGANWTYVLWGIYHGLLFIPSILMRNTGIKKIGTLLTTFILVCIGWILFRAENIRQAFLYIQKIITQSGFIPNIDAFGLSKIMVISTFIFILFLQGVEWVQRNKEHGLQIDAIKSVAVRWGIYLLIILFILVFPGKQETFIYFQF